MRIDQFIGRQQLATMRSCCRGEEGEWFKAKLDELKTLFATMPKTYEQDGRGDQAVVYLHYFAGGSASWFITERDMEPEQHQAFGLADLYGDGGELGYISIVELLECGAELDLYWTPKTLEEVRAKREQLA